MEVSLRLRMDNALQGRGMTCNTCHWFERDWVRDDAQSEYGKCLKHAPVTGIMAGTHVTLFPRVGQRDTCGDYQKESK
jgi:hypothetical protein